MLGATLLRKRSVAVLNFGGSKTTSVPLSENLLKRQVHTYVKMSAKLNANTFFYNSYRYDKKKFTELRIIGSKFMNKNIDDKVEIFLYNLRDLVDICQDYQAEEELLVNISEIKCKVTKVDT